MKLHSPKIVGVSQGFFYVNADGTTTAVGPVISIPLATDPDKGVKGTAGDWIPATSLRIRLDSAKLVGATLQVRVSLRAETAGVGVTARLRNVTDGTTAGTSTKVTATTLTEVTFSVTATSGVKYYWLELSPDTTAAYVFGIGMLESV